MRKFFFAAASCAAMAAAFASSAQVVSPSEEQRRLDNPVSSPCVAPQVASGSRCIDPSIAVTAPGRGGGGGGGGGGRAAAPAGPAPAPGSPAERALNALAAMNSAGWSRYARLGNTRMVYAAIPGAVLTYSVNGNEYTFVKRISLDYPASMATESISAMMANPTTNMIYVSTRGSLIAIDLATDKVVWRNRYEESFCCERGAVVNNGQTLVVGSNLRDFHYVINAKTGALEGKIQMPHSPGIHNMNVSPDGKIDFGAPNGFTMTVADIASRKIKTEITFSDHVRVFVINHDATKVYANLNNLLGFEIADVATGKVIKRVEMPAEMWKAKWADPNLQFFGHGAPHHGIAMLPDESEIWITDAINKTVDVFDNTGPTPVYNPAKSFATNGNENGWITYNITGTHAFMASGDVVDIATHKVIAQLKDENGKYYNSEKFLELQFGPGGKLNCANLQFANGDTSWYNARVNGTARPAVVGNGGVIGKCGPMPAVTAARGGRAAAAAADPTRPATP